jgi:alpha-L-fucosidase
VNPLFRAKFAVLPLALLSLPLLASPPTETGTTANPVTSLSDQQVDFMKWKFGMFVHFSLATFAGTDWAGGYENPDLFDPGRLDCGQWADAAKEAGMTYLVLTVKHTDGIALYPSGVTTRDSRLFRKFRDGRGDIVREFVNACRSRALRVGLYYCFPGNYADVAHRNAPPPGKPDFHGLPAEAVGDYVGFMKRQLAELLTNYGPIDLLWIDQYRNRYTAERWPEILAFLRALQPHCLVLANNARNLTDSDVLGYEYPWKSELPPRGNVSPAEVCDTLQTGARWFWRDSPHPADLQAAADIAAKVRMCNGLNANYLLDVPPDRDGLISGPQLQRLREVGALLQPGNADKAVTLK